MGAYLQLLRPLNTAMAAVAVFVGALVALGTGLFSSPDLPSVLVAATVAAMYTGAGNVLNDYYDRETDRVNHPDRPLPQGKLEATTALRFSGVLFVLGGALAFLIGFPEPKLPCVILALFNGMMLALYEIRLKPMGFAGNLTVSYLTASLFLFGGMAASDTGRTPIPLPVLLMAILAFLASVGREIIKGIEDVKGDINRKTLPRVIGVRGAGIAAFVWLALAVALSPLPVYPFGLFGANVYLPVVLAADAIFIYSALVVFKNPGRASKTTKAAMAIALLAFLLGSLTV